MNLTLDLKEELAKLQNFLNRHSKAQSLITFFQAIIFSSVSKSLKHKGTSSTDLES